MKKFKKHKYNSDIREVWVKERVNFFRSRWVFSHYLSSAGTVEEPCGFMNGVQNFKYLGHSGFPTTSF